MHALETALQDVRHGLRLMHRSPAFTLTAVLTLGFTIAAVSTVLTLGHTFFLRPLPVAGAGELVEVSATRNQGTETGLVSYPDYLHFRDATRTLAELAAVYPSAPLFVTAGDESREVSGALVSANFFPMVGLEPAVGRFFGTEEDSVPGRDRVVVLGHDLWRTWFGASPDALGATVEINDVSFTVVGVAPPSFRGIGPRPARIYLPTMMLPVGYRWCANALAADCTILRMIGRLGEGAGIEDARAEMATLVPPRWQGAAPGENSGVTVRRARGSEPGPVATQFLQLLSLVAAALLLVCCANVAGLLIARGSARSRELAIRTSLGAPRVRLLRQLLTESLLLAVSGGGLGVVLSVGLTHLLDASFFSVDSSGHALRFDFSLEPAVILAVLGLSLLAGLLFGVLPALRSVGQGAAAVLPRQAATVTARSGANRWLLAAQAAVAVALVVVAALLSVSAWQVIGAANLDPSRVALLRLRPRLVGYAPDQAQRFLRTAVERLEALPGVESVTMVGTGAALSGLTTDLSLADGQILRAGYIEIGPRYFETLGTPLLRGREFTRQDTVASLPVAVVNQALARRLWPQGGAIGSTVRVNDRRHTVIGLAADVPLQSRAEAPRPYVYVPFWQNPKQVDARLQVRVGGDPKAMLRALVREVHRLDPAVPITDTLTLSQRMAGWFRPLRMSATAVSYAAALAVVLSALGLYASLAFAVARRTREIGIRQAVGASANHILVLIVREGMVLILMGVGAGLTLALAGSDLLRYFLYGSATGDGLVYAAAGLLVAVVGLVACWAPARRAARMEPMEALRLE